MLPSAPPSSEPGRTVRRGHFDCLPLGGWKRTALLLALLMLSAAGLGFAQSLAVPAVVEFEHDGRGVNGFVLYATRREDGAQRRFDLGMASKTKSGRLQLALPLLEPGTWRLELAAYNTAGESPRANADPSEVRIAPTVRKPPPAVQPPATAKDPTTPGVRKPSTPPPPKPPPPPKKKKGAMGKLWSLIVGEDDPK